MPWAILLRLSPLKTTLHVHLDQILSLHKGGERECVTGVDECAHAFTPATPTLHLDDPMLANERTCLSWVG